MGERGTIAAARSEDRTTATTRPEVASTRSGAVAPAAGRVTALARARQRRERWRDAVRLLQAAASLGVDPDPELRAWWRDEIREAAHRVDAVLAEHVEATEGPRGLFAAILTDAPHTAPSIARLCNDHAQLLSLSGRLRWQVERDDDEPVNRLTRELLALLDAHHHRGAEALHAAYAVDVGVGD